MFKKVIRHEVLLRPPTLLFEHNRISVGFSCKQILGLNHFSFPSFEPSYQVQKTHHLHQEATNSFLKQISNKKINNTAG
jgi:hypothetical protein